MNVAVMGATDKTDRYAYMAFKLLKDHGHKVFPVHSKIRSIDGAAVFSSLSDISEAINTITIYVNSKISGALTEEILAKAPKRIIFNPGTENPDLETRAFQMGINVVNDCTLVMLKRGQF